jgi:hypothetical protein
MLPKGWSTECSPQQIKVPANCCGMYRHICHSLCLSVGFGMYPQNAQTVAAVVGHQQLAHKAVKCLARGTPVPAARPYLRPVGEESAFVAWCPEWRPTEGGGQ